MAAGIALFYGGSAFLLGILFASFTPRYSLFLGLIAILGIFIFARIRSWPIIQASCILSLVFVGIFYFHFYLNLRDVYEKIPLGAPSRFSGVISEEPRFTENSQRLVIEIAPPFRGNIALILGRFPEFKYGDTLYFQGSINERLSPRDLPTVIFPEILSREENSGFSLKRHLIDFKQSMIDGFRHIFPRDASALLGGILLGQKSDFSNEFKDAMRQSGTTHLVALSGYNIAILVFSVHEIAKRFLSRKKRFYLTSMVILLFVLMVGVEASIIRAAIMGLIVLLAEYVGRMHSFGHSALLAATLMALQDPLILRYDLGFQLSFVSLLGIFYLSPALSSLKKSTRFKQKEKKSFFEELVTTTLGAQLAVIPILLSTFGSISLVSIIPNILILWLIPGTMLLGSFMGAIHFLSPGLATIFSLPLHALLYYETGIIRFFGNTNLSLHSMIHPLIFGIIYYMILFAFIMHQKKSINDQ